MAKNYSIAEAVQIIAENADTASITDIGKRFPLLANKIARVAVLAGDEFVDFASYLPEHVSANKVNKAIKEADDAAEVDDDDDVEDDTEVEAEAAPKKKAGRPKKAAKAEEPEDDEDEDGESDSDYDNMSNKELWALLGEVGGRKKCREEFGDTKTADMLKFFKKYYPNGVDAEQPEEAEDEESGDEYAGKSAVELYKLCKTRKIKAEQKKPAKYYIDLLKKADAAAAKTKKKAEPEEDEEWDDDEEEPAPKKAKEKPAKAEKPEKKPAKKATPVEEGSDDDDDDEWEI